MAAPESAPSYTRTDVITWLSAAVALWLVLKLHLLPALLAGLLVFELIAVMVPRLRMKALDHTLGAGAPRLLAVGLVATGVIALLGGIGVGVVAFFKNSGESIPALFERMAQIIEQSRERFPPWFLASLPDTAEELRTTVVEWLRAHAGFLQGAGADIGRALAHILIGMIIGALLSLQLVGDSPSQPLSRWLFERTARLSQAFRRVVFAQAWISAINTCFTAIYLAIVLPACGVDLPFTFKYR